MSLDHFIPLSVKRARRGFSVGTNSCCTERCHKAEHLGCAICPDKVHCINTVTFPKRNDFGHYLNDCCSDFHLHYYIIIYEVVSHVFSDSCWVSEPCKQPPLMTADLTDRRSDTDPCVNITDTPRENLWSSVGLSVKHGLKGKED